MAALVLRAASLPAGLPSGLGALWPLRATILAIAGFVLLAAFSAGYLGGLSAGACVVGCRRKRAAPPASAPKAKARSTTAASPFKRRREVTLPSGSVCSVPNGPSS